VLQFDLVAAGHTELQIQKLLLQAAGDPVADA
jgi:hypothetical protein